MSWQDDPIETVAAPAPAPAWTSDPIVSDAAPDASAAKGGVLGGVLMGLRDPIDAGAQLARRAVPEWLGKIGDDFGNYLAAHGFPVTPSSGVPGVDSIVQKANATYDASRALAGRDGVDIARIVGNVANPVNRVIPIEGAKGLQLAGRAAMQGGLSGLATPVTTPTDGSLDFLGRKFEQGTAGAAAGAVLAPVANSFAVVGSDVGRRLGAAFRTVTPADVEAAVQAAAKAHDVNLADIAPAELDNVRAQVRTALEAGKTIDPAAAVRMAEGESVLGPDANLTQAQASRSPAAFTTERNIRGLPGGEPIMDRLSAQSGALTSYLNNKGAKAVGSDAYDTGGQMLNALRGADDVRRAGVSSLYDQANALNGGEITLDGHAFSEAADAALNPKGGVSITRFLPDTIKGYLNDVSSGVLPLNVSTAENLKTILATASRGATDGNTRKAIGAVRDALEQAQPTTQLGADATNAFAAARAAHADRMSTIESTPALKAAIDPTTNPDQFFDRYVLKGDANDVKAMVGALSEAGPPAIQNIRKQVINRLKTAGISDSNEDAGATFSQAGYNKALAAIGDQRLRALFTPDEIADLHKFGRVAANVQVGPAGNAASTSNSANVVYSLLSKIADSVPGVKGIKAFAGEQSNAAAARNALRGQVSPQAPEAPVNALRPYLLPLSSAGATAGGQLVQ